VKESHYQLISAILSLCERAARDMDEKQQVNLILLIANRFQVAREEREMRPKTKLRVVPPCDTE
jgi:hypothetical protein